MAHPAVAAGETDPAADAINEGGICLLALVRGRGDSFSSSIPRRPARHMIASFWFFCCTLIKHGDSVPIGLFIGTHCRRRRSCCAVRLARHRHLSSPPYLIYTRNGYYTRERMFSPESVNIYKKDGFFLNECGHIVNRTTSNVQRGKETANRIRSTTRHSSVNIVATIQWCSRKSSSLSLFFVAYDEHFGNHNE